MGARAVPDLVAAAREQPLARTVALAALVEIDGPEALAGLIELAGHGDRALRRAVDLTLGKRPPAELGALLQAAAAASDAKTQADLYRAAGLLARRGSPAQRETAARALAEALGSAADYERRYRLLVAAGGLADPIAIAAVAAALRSLAGSEDPRQVALRRVATSALGENEHPDATPLLVEATRDPDPGVRSRAISALGERDAAAGDTELVANLEGDRWPRVRRAAAGALGTRCARPEPRASLIRAATRENDVAVGQVVLSSLVTCAGAEATDSLLAVALGGQRPTKLRIHAVLQIARIGGEPRATRMLELFDRFVQDSWSSEASLALAQAAAAGLARLGDRRAVKPLMRAARESSFPEIQAAAARALGSFCAPGTAKLLRQLASSPQIAVSIAAKSSLRQCKQRSPRL
jgi:HEAT repeat protein